MLRVYKRNATSTAAIDLSANFAGPVAADAALLVNDRSLAVSNGKVFFRVPENAAASETTVRLSQALDGTPGDNFAIINPYGNAAPGKRALELVSLRDDQAQIVGATEGAMSATGRFIVFYSNGPATTGYVSSTCPNSVYSSGAPCGEILLRDLVAGTTEVVSLGPMSTGTVWATRATPRCRAPR